MGGSKRKRESDGKSGGKKAKNYSMQSNASLPLNARGFLVSCPAGKERPAGHEALHLLQSYYEAALPKTEEGGAEAKDQDISSQLDKEIAELRNPKLQVFSIHKTGVHGLCFIVMKPGVPGPDPAEILLAIAEDVRTTKQSKARLCMRFTPVDTVCQASLNDMRAAAKKIVQSHFPTGEGAESKTFAVQYEHRASASFDRLTVIKTVAECVEQPPHKANLNSPDLSIMVEVMKNVCAMGVALRYREFAKFNFQELCNADEKAAAKAAKPEPGSAQAEAGHAAAEPLKAEGTADKETADKDAETAAGKTDAENENEEGAKRVSEEETEGEAEQQGEAVEAGKSGGT